MGSGICYALYRIGNACICNRIGSGKCSRSVKNWEYLGVSGGKLKPSNLIRNWEYLDGIEGKI